MADILRKLSLFFKRPHVYKFDGGPPWVIARDEREAREHAERDFGTVEQVPDDADFTMFYSDPYGLEPVDPLDPCEYDCVDQHNHITQRCGDWARFGFGIDGPVAWEFEG